MSPDPSATRSASSDRRRPRARASIRVRSALIWAGVVPQHPPITATPAFEHDHGQFGTRTLEVNGETVQRAQVTPALCLGCGACAAVCPENAINVNGMTLKQYEAMVDRIVSETEAA